MIENMGVETVRKSITLTPQELAELDAARTAGTPQHEALAELAGQGVGKSDASVLEALVTLGLEVVQGRVLEHGYAALAASQDDEDRAYHQAIRSRRRETEE